MVQRICLFMDDKIHVTIKLNHLKFEGVTMVWVDSSSPIFDFLVELHSSHWLAYLSRIWKNSEWIFSVSLFRLHLHEKEIRVNRHLKIIYEAISPFTKIDLWPAKKNSSFKNTFKINAGSLIKFLFWTKCLNRFT